VGVLGRHTTRDAEAFPIGDRLRRTAAVTALVLMLMAVAGSTGRLSAQVANEYEVKAAFLYKFASFVEWPAESAQGLMCIAVLGQDPFGAALDQVVRGKSINGRAFSIQRFKSGQDATGCPIVFIGASEKSRVRSILDRLQGLGILTVSEIPGFCRDGGMIGFELLEQKVRFEINPEAAERARLKLSSKLLSVAKIVREGRP
jgi:hypothetical protein